MRSKKKFTCYKLELTQTLGHKNYTKTCQNKRKSGCLKRMRTQSGKNIYLHTHGSDKLNGLD